MTKKQLAKGKLMEYKEQTKKERWIVDDAGTLIDMVTRETYDIVEEVVNILNYYENTCLRYEKTISELKGGTYKEPLPITQESDGEMTEKAITLIDKTIAKYQRAMTEEPSITNHYCNNIQKDLKKIRHIIVEENEQLKLKIKSINEILSKDMGYVESFKKIEEILK